MRYFFTPGVRAQLRREIVAQLDKFLATGLPLSHVDGHLTIHVHPVVLGILLDLRDRYGIRAVRLPREPLAPALRYDRRHLAAQAVRGDGVQQLVALGGAAPRPRRPAPPRSLFGLHQTGHVSEQYLLAVLAELPPGVSEIYCHPAVDDDEARRWRPADYDSEQELAALTSARVREAIERAGIELITYRDVGVRMRARAPTTRWSS